MTTQDYPGLLLEKRGHTALITLHNPPAHTWTAESLTGLARLVRDLDADRDITDQRVRLAYDLSMTFQLPANLRTTLAGGTTGAGRDTTDQALA